MDQKTSPRVVRALRNLAVALINATLIISAVCLWLTWKVLSTAEAVSHELATTAETLRPAVQSMRELSGEVSRTRSELTALRAGLAPGTVDALAERLGGIEDELAQMNRSLALQSRPGTMVDDRLQETVRKAAGTLVTVVGHLCRTEEPPAPPSN